MRIDRSSDIVLLNHDPIEIDKGFGDHVEPFIRESLGLLLESIPQKSTPSQHLLQVERLQVSVAHSRQLNLLIMSLKF